jgi:hypothetical protein
MVQVRSDVVPEPNTGLLVPAGLLGLAEWRRARALREPVPHDVRERQVHGLRSP